MSCSDEHLIVIQKLFFKFIQQYNLARSKFDFTYLLDVNFNFLNELTQIIPLEYKEITTKMAEGQKLGNQAVNAIKEELLETRAKFEKLKDNLMKTNEALNMYRNKCAANQKENKNIKKVLLSSESYKNSIKENLVIKSIAEKTVSNWPVSEIKFPDKMIVRTKSPGGMPRINLYGGASRVDSFMED